MAETRSEIHRRHRATATPDDKSTQHRAPPKDDRVDAVIHERTRLAMVGALAARERLSFAELKAILKATDGNVSAHARKLEDAGYIVAHKRFEGRMPRTEYELTDAGRQALNAYLEQMERLISAVKQH